MYDYYEQPLPPERFNYVRAIRESDGLDWRWIKFGHGLARNLGARSYGPQWIDAPAITTWRETAPVTEATLPMGNTPPTTQRATRTDDEFELPHGVLWWRRAIAWLLWWRR